MRIIISGDMSIKRVEIGIRLAELCNSTFVDFDREAAESVIDTYAATCKHTDNLVCLSNVAWHFDDEAMHIHLISNAPSLEELEATHAEIVHIFETYRVARVECLQHADIVCCIGTREIDVICKGIRNTISNCTGRVLIADPRVLIPTQTTREVWVDRIEHYRGSGQGIILLDDCDMAVTLMGVYILDGHHKVAAACLDDIDFILTYDFVVAPGCVIPLSMYEYRLWKDQFKAELTRVTDELTKLSWCKRHAPESLLGCSEQELLEALTSDYMHFICD